MYCSMQTLHSNSWDTLATLRMPTTRKEEYRYTDIAPLLKADLQVSLPPQIALQ